MLCAACRYLPALAGKLGDDDAGGGGGDDDIDDAGSDDYDNNDADYDLGPVITSVAGQFASQQAIDEVTALQKRLDSQVGAMVYRLAALSHIVPHCATLSSLHIVKMHMFSSAAASEELIRLQDNC